MQGTGYPAHMNKTTIQRILKDQGLTSRSIVCTGTGFSIRDIRFKADRELPYGAVQMVALAFHGHGYTFKMNERERNGKSHYQFAIDRIIPTQ